MKILMTGGTGLIGLCFIEQFSGYQYTVLTRNPNKTRSKLPASVALIASLDELQNLDDFDAVINLAGEPIIDKRWSDQQKNVISQSRWQITQQLVALFGRSKKPPRIFLSGSAIGIYGNRGDERLTESSDINNYDFASALCRQWEDLAMQAGAYSRVVVIRTGIVLATRGGALAKMLLPFKCCLGGRIGNGRQYMSWIHYQDHINAINYLLTAEQLSGAVNLVAPKPVINQLFTQTLAKCLHRFAIFPVPKKALQWLLGESSCLLLDSQRVIPKKLIDSGFTFSFPDLKPALANILNSSANKEVT